MTLARIQSRLKRVERRKVEVRQGTITATSPLSVSIGGGKAITGVKGLPGWTPTTNQRVNVAVWGRDLLVLGPASATPSQAGGVELGYAQITSNDTQAAGGNKDVAGLSVTVTVGARPIKVIFDGRGLSNNATNGVGSIGIKEGATQLAEISLSNVSVANILSPSCHREVRLNPSAGAHTYKINLSSVLGTTTLFATANSPTFIQVIEV